MDFDDIKNIWKQSLDDNELLNKDEIEVKLKIKKSSNIALNKVKRNLKMELILSGPFSVFVLVWLFLNIHSSDKYLIILFSFLFFSALLAFTFYNYSKVKDAMISSDQLRPALQDTIRNVERYVNFNKSNFTKYILFPFAILFGMILGLHAGAGDKDMLELFSSLNNSSLVKMLAVFIMGSILMVPLSQYLNKKMYKQHLDELKQCLKEFDEIEE